MRWVRGNVSEEPVPISEEVVGFPRLDVEDERTERLTGVGEVGVLAPATAVQALPAGSVGSVGHCNLLGGRSVSGRYPGRSAAMGVLG
jgi:hypothetical protein